MVTVITGTLGSQTIIENRHSHSTKPHRHFHNQFGINRQADRNLNMELAGRVPSCTLIYLTLDVVFDICLT